jgi:hypothetical protein
MTTLRFSAAIAIGVAACLAPTVSGQAASPMVAVSGEGGGVEGFFANPDGSLQAVSSYARNVPYDARFSPDGSMLAVLEYSDAEDYLDVVSVAGDGSLQRIAWKFVGAAAGVYWLSDSVLAVNGGGFFHRYPGLSTFRVDRDANQLVLIASSDIDAAYNSQPAYHEASRTLYLPERDEGRFDLYRIADDFTFTKVGELPVDQPPMGGLARSPDGARFYGTQQGGDEPTIVGYQAAADGTLTPLPGSPYATPGSETGSIAFNADGSLMIYCEFSLTETATMFTLAVAPDGSLTPTGHSIALPEGPQDVAFLRDYLHVVTNDGANSAVHTFELHDDGTITSASGPAPLNNGYPYEIEVWDPGCPADINGDGRTNTLDVLAFLNVWASDGDGADFNGDGTVDTQDVLAFLNAWAAGC